MTPWKVYITDEAKKDYFSLENSLKKRVLAGILKVAQVPMPRPDGYGTPLGNVNGTNLTGFFKIKFRSIGIRVVYTLVIDKQIMNIVVISKRDDDFCYKLALKLYRRYGSKVFEDIFNLFQ